MKNKIWVLLVLATGFCFSDAMQVGKNLKFNYNPVLIVIKQRLGVLESPMNDVLEGYPVDIRGNKFNLQDYPATYIAIYTGSGGKGPDNKKILERDPQVGTITSEYVIIAPEQQKIYTNIRAQMSSPTGTPGSLRDNYFGTFWWFKDSIPGMTGSGKRLDFYLDQ